MWISRTIRQGYDEDAWAGIGVSEDFDIKPNTNYKVWYRFVYKLVGCGALRDDGYGARTETRNSNVSSIYDYHGEPFTTKQVPYVTSASYTLGGNLSINIGGVTLPDVNIKPNVDGGGFISSGIQQFYRLIIRGCRLNSETGGFSDTFDLVNEDFFTTATTRTVEISPYNAGRLYYSLTRDIYNSGAGIKYGYLWTMTATGLKRVFPSDPV